MLKKQFFFFFFFCWGFCFVHLPKEFFLRFFFGYQETTSYSTLQYKLYNLTLNVYGGKDSKFEFSHFQLNEQWHTNRNSPTRVRIYRL